MQSMRCKNGTPLRLRVTSIAGPAIFYRMLNHGRPDRIQFNVPLPNGFHQFPRSARLLWRQQHMHVLWSSIHRHVFDTPSSWHTPPTTQGKIETSASGRFRALSCGSDLIRSVAAADGFADDLFGAKILWPRIDWRSDCFSLLLLIQSLALIPTPGRRTLLHMRLDSLSFYPLDGGMELLVFDTGATATGKENKRCRFRL